MSKIFISHSSQDKELVDIFVDTLLICGMGFSIGDIFCSSVDGLGIEAGKNWRNEIREKLVSSKVIILFITPNYKESEMCLNEMGAAWTIDIKVIPVVISPIDFKSIGVIFDVKQSIKLTEETGLDELKDALQEFVPIQRTSIWTKNKKKAIRDFDQKLTPCPFLTPLSRDEFTKLEEELSEIKQAFGDVVVEKQNLSEQCERLKKAKDKDEVIAIEKDMGLLEDYDEFFSKAEEFGKEINKFDPIVRTMIFNEFTKKGLSLTTDDIRFRKEELNNAIARNIIYDYEHLNRQNRQVVKVLNMWNDFEKFFPKEVSEETYKKIESEYPNIALETDNLDFWKEVLGVETLLF